MQDSGKAAIGGVVVGVLLLVGFIYLTNPGVFSGARMTLPSISTGVSAPAAAPVAAGAAGCADSRLTTVDSSAIDAQAGTPISSGADIYFYDTSKLPSDPTSNATASTAIGTQLAADPDVKTCKDMYILYTDATGTATYYDVSLGGVTGTGKNREPKVTQIPGAPGVTAATLSSSVSFKDGLAPHQNATIKFPMNLLSTDVNGANNSSLDVSGVEIGCDDGTGRTNPHCEATGAETVSNATLTYDRSVGDGNYFLDLTAEAVGGNKALQGFMMCIGTNVNGAGGMDGDEFTSITAQWRSGRDYFSKGGLTSEIVNVWKNDGCIRLYPSEADPWVNGGESGVFRLTFTITEANWVEESFRICFDDLYDINGRDLRLGAGATSQCIVINTQA